MCKKCNKRQQISTKLLIQIGTIMRNPDTYEQPPTLAYLGICRKFCNHSACSQNSIFSQNMKKEIFFSPFKLGNTQRSTLLSNLQKALQPFPLL